LSIFDVAYLDNEIMSNITASHCVKNITITKHVELGGKAIDYFVSLLIELSYFFYCIIGFYCNSQKKSDENTASKQTESESDFAVYLQRS